MAIPTSVIVVIVTAITLFIIVIFCWFCWVIVGLRKLWYRIFQRGKINQVLDLLYENQDNPMFNHTRVEKYIKLGFYNPAIFEIAEKIYYKQNQRTTKRTAKLDARELKRTNKLNAKEIKQYERTKHITKPIREVESFEIPNEEYAEPEPELTEPTYEYPPAPRTRAGEPRGVPRAEPRAIQPTRAVEPRADTSYPARAPANRQVARQRDLQIRSSEKPIKKSRYFD